MSLLVVDRTGRTIAERYAKTVGRKLSYGTLYATLRRLREEGLVEVHSEEGDRRFRLFRLTGAGKRALNEGREFYRELSTFGMAKGAVSTT